MEANLHSKFTTSHRVESGQMVGSDAFLSLNLNMHVLFGLWELPKGVLCNAS